jgi:riboflavin transporter 2
VAFLPYVGANFLKEYIIANYIGESLSSLIPGTLAIIQGSIDSKEECNNNKNILNQTNPISNLTTQQQHHLNNNNNYNKKLSFSVSSYFLLMLALLLCSSASFVTLNYSNYVKRFRKPPESRLQIVYDLDSDIQIERSSNSSSSRFLIENKREANLLFSLTAILTFFYYGFLPGLLSYSTIPYGNIYFHLSVNLSKRFLFLEIFFLCFQL